MATARFGGLTLKPFAKTARLGGMTLHGTALNTQATGQFGGLSFAGVPFAATPGKARLGGMMLAGPKLAAGDTAKFGGVSLSGTAIVGRSTAILGGLRLTGSSGPTLAPVQTVVAEPGTTVVFTAEANPGSPELVNFVWRQVSGPAVTLAGRNEMRKFVAPGNVAAQTVVLGVIGKDASGNASGEVLCSAQILPQTMMSLSGSTYKPSIMVDTPDIVMPNRPRTRNGLLRKPVYAEDFNTPADLGAFTSTPPYSNMGYYITARDHFTDTSGKGDYVPDTTLSAHDSCLDVFFHTLNGRPQVACVMPDAYAPHTYGRMDMRFKAPVVPGYKFVGIMWPNSDDWNDGEIDWPESRLGGISRPANAAPGTYSYPQGMKFYPITEVFAPTDMSEFHVASMEWDPGHLRFYWDDVKVTSIDNPAYIPKGPMRITLQFETWTDGGDVPPDASGHLLLDWIVFYDAGVAV